MRIAFIRSGGQTGADRGALDAARAMNIPIAGWVPLNGWAEDKPYSPGVLELYPELKETGFEDIRIRTEYNVRDSHATLIIDPGSDSPGTELTVEFAKSYQRPHYISQGDDCESVVKWLNTLPDGITLNVAGPRESECPGTYSKSYTMVKFLIESLQEKK